MIRYSISTQALRRLPVYLSYLKSLPEKSDSNISATTIAQALCLNDVQVRKDLSLITSGRPKTGHVIESLIAGIEKFLGYDDVNRACLVGVGNLGHALLSFSELKDCGFDIEVAFDRKQSLIGTQVNGKPILHVDKLRDLCYRMKICVGIITVPAFEAQRVCNELVGGGVMAVWNFAPVHLKVPDNVLVQQENLAGSLTVLSRHLAEKNHQN